jgi:hypothetical protein
VTPPRKDRPLCRRCKEWRRTNQAQGECWSIERSHELGKRGLIVRVREDDTCDHFTPKVVWHGAR